MHSSTGLRRIKIGTAILGLAAAAGLGVAACAPPSNALASGFGVNQYGKTDTSFGGTTVVSTYTHGFYCDRTVTSAASTGCEVGATFVRPPQTKYDPLYITVPLGFTVPMNMLQCPAGLVCVNHPGTLDMTRIEASLKPFYPQLTAAQLTDALKNFVTPGHDHFIATTNQGKPEWWDLKVIGVKNKATYDDIFAHHSTAYIAQLQRAHNPNVTPTISTNVFEYFSVS